MRQPEPKFQADLFTKRGMAAMADMRPARHWHEATPHETGEGTESRLLVCRHLACEQTQHKLVASTHSLQPLTLHGELATSDVLQLSFTCPTSARPQLPESYILGPQYSARKLKMCQSCIISLDSQRNINAAHVM